MKKRLFLIPLCVLLVLSSVACRRDSGFDGGTVLDAAGVAEKQAQLAAENAAAEEAARVTPDTACYWIAGSEVYHLDRNCAYIKESATVESGTVASAEAAGAVRACSHCKKP